MHPRFQLTVNRRRLAEWAGVKESSVAEEGFDRTFYNHHHFPVLSLSPAGIREVRWMRQGLIPAFAPDERHAEEREEAHAETLTCSSCFRSGFRRRRCLVPADRVNELSHSDGRSLKACTLGLSTGEIFSMAGLWETWQNEHGLTVETFAVVTVLVAPVLRAIFDRMPVVIGKADENVWLHANPLEDPPSRLLQPLSVDQLRGWNLTPYLLSDQREQVRPVDGC